MKKTVTLWIAMGIVLTIGTTTIHARDLQPGTWSIGGAASTGYTHSEADHAETSDSISANLSLGRLLWKNIEVGAGLSGDYANSTNSTSYGYSLTPFITYHIAMSEISGFYLSAGAGYGQTTTEPKNSQTITRDSLLAFGEGGWQYFFNSNVALNFGLRYTHRKDSGGNRADDDFNIVTGIIRLKLYY